MDVALHPQFATNKLRLSLIRQADSTKRDGDRDRARPLERYGADRCQRCLRRPGWRRRRRAHGLWSRRHDVCDDGGGGGNGSAGSQWPERQSAAPQGRRDGADLTTPSSAAPDIGPRSTRSDIEARSDSRCIRGPERSGRTRTGRTAATKSTSSSRARITAGRS